MPWTKLMQYSYKVVSAYNIMGQYSYSSPAL